MRGHSYISDIEALKDWFEKTAQTQWKLLRGFHERVRDKPMIYCQADEAMDLAESWGLLSHMIDINSEGGGGRFTVFVPTMTNGKGPTVFFQVGDLSSSSRYPSLAGGPSAGAVSKQDVQEMIAKERRMWDLERQLEDLQAAQDANADFRDVFLEKLREVDLSPVISGITSMFTRQSPPAVKLQGTPFEFDYPQRAADTGQPSGQEKPEGFVYEGDKLLPILDSIREHFGSNEEFFRFLEKLAATFQQNPALYKQMFL